jgi:hypothetical protein
VNRYLKHLLRELGLSERAHTQRLRRTVEARARAGDAAPTYVGDGRAQRAAIFERQLREKLSHEHEQENRQTQPPQPPAAEVGAQGKARKTRGVRDVES